MGADGVRTWHQKKPGVSAGLFFQYYRVPGCDQTGLMGSWLVMR